MNARCCALAILLLACRAGVGSSPGAPDLVRLEPGLVSGAVIHDTEDYESLSVLQAVSAEGQRRGLHWTIPDANVPGGKRELAATTLTRAADVESARRVILVHITGDPESFPGATTGGLSRQLFAELREKGEAAVVIGATRSDGKDVLVSLFAGRKYYRGTLKRVESGTVAMPVLLDGRRTTLPAVHVRGEVLVGADKGTAEFWVLDDPANPMTLKWEVLNASSQIVRIDNAVARTGGTAAGGSVEVAAALASASCRAQLHGVYFNTGSATLLRESAPALAQVGAALVAHADWQVLVEGHTDNIGAADANLALSSRRAQAVREYLLSAQSAAPARLEARGFGATRPVESNATVEGRAHNRRVELSRRCPG